jgi:hypothetical protein
MFHRWAALLLVLAFCAMTPKNAAGQTQSQQPRGQSAGGAIRRNYPNPFNPETYISFDVDKDVCTDGSQQHVVTLRIYNILMQQVAVGVLWGSPTTSTTSVPSELVGRQLDNIRIGCGYYIGYWNGKVNGTGREASSGTYLARLYVDGRLVYTHKMFIAK